MSRLNYDFDERTGIIRMQSSHNVAYVTNRDIRRSRLIIGRGGMILRDILGGRTGRRCSDEIIREYEETAQ